jgi:hypothetical protein
MGDAAGPVGRDEIARIKLYAVIALLIGLAAAAVALFAGVSALRVSNLFSTEEPAIRVRNGSQDLVALSDYWSRDTTGNDKKWHVRNGTYNNKHLKVTFWYRAGTCDGTFASADKLTVEYTNGGSTNSVRITQPGHKLSVDSDNDLTPNSTERVVSYGPGGEGYISKVFLDQNPKPYCTFTSDQDLGAIEIVN